MGIDAVVAVPFEGGNGGRDESGAEGDEGGIAGGMAAQLYMQLSVPAGTGLATA